MITVGLTGGIATGKSTVSKILEKNGAIIIDADKIARDEVMKGKPAWESIVSYFGHEILLQNNEINRTGLGDIIFKNPEKKSTLNNIVHPFVFREISKQLSEFERNKSESVVIVDVPLLIESEMYRDMADIIVVYIPETLQMKRLMARDLLSKGEAIARIRSQMPIREKKDFATIVIDNSGSLEKTEEKTLAVYKYLKSKT